MAYRKYLPCSQCNRLVLVAGKPQKGDFVECPHGLRQAREPFPATVYYENAVGKRLYADKIPKEFEKLGYQRIEVSGFERRKFEKHTREQLNAEASRRREGERQEYEAERDRNHAELREMSQQWDSFHRDVAMESIRQEQNEYSGSYDSEFRVGRD